MVCQVKGNRNILKLICRPLVFTSYKALKKKKRSLFRDLVPDVL